MSQTAAIAIAIHGRHSVLGVVDTLLQAGWAHYRLISYLPMGADESFEWVQSPLDTWPAVRSILDEKARRGEMVGLELRWGETLIGAGFILRPDGRISMALSDERPRVEGADRFTDMTWFLARVLPSLLGAGFVVASVECFDIA
jgi:hypothetical protein